MCQIENIILSNWEHCLPQSLRGGGGSLPLESVGGGAKEPPPPPVAILGNVYGTGLQ